MASVMFLLSGNCFPIKLLNGIFLNRINYTAKFKHFYFRDTNFFTYMINKGGQEFIDDIVGLHLFFSESAFLFSCLRPCCTLKITSK